MKEVTYEDWKKNLTPRMMWVWDNEIDDKEKKKVVYIMGKNSSFPVITVEQNDGVVYFKHCAEIEEPKKRRMTNKEFTLWLLEGIRNGKLRQWRRINSDTIESVPCGYTSEYEDLFVENKLIRENGGKWHEPLVEV